MSLKKPLLRSLFENNILQDTKIQLLVNQMELINEIDLTNYLSTIGQPYSDISVKGKMPTIDKNSLNQILIEKPSSKDEDNKIRIYTKRK